MVDKYSGWIPRYQADVLDIRFDARLDQASYGSRIPSRAHIHHAAISHGVPRKGLKAWIKETYTQWIIAPCGCPGQLLIEVGQKRKIPTDNMFWCRDVGSLVIDTW